jgi:hypothetical protein
LNALQSAQSNASVDSVYGLPRSQSVTSSHNAPSVSIIDNLILQPDGKLVYRPGYINEKMREGKCDSKW